MLNINLKQRLGKHVPAAKDNHATILKQEEATGRESRFREGLSPVAEE
jgi:hypothetical protein